jgi:hypothetical protein
MGEANHDPDRDDMGYVGAPTEFADAQEVPEWVATAAKALFFLPTAFVTATTIPIVLGAILLLACCVIFTALSYLF